MVNSILRGVPCRLPAMGAKVAWREGQPFVGPGRVGLVGPVGCF